MARKIVTVDDALHLPTAVRNQLSADVTADLASVVDGADDAAAAAALSATNAATSATNAATSASEAVAAVTGDADSVVAGLIADTGSDVYTALLAAGLDSGFVPATIAAGVNYNTILTPGWYSTTSTNTNAPVAGSIVLQVQAVGTLVVQTAFSSANAAAMYARYSVNTGSTWSAWKSVSFSDHTHTPASLGVYAASDLDTILAAIQDSFVDSEDLFGSTLREAAIPNSGNTTIPLFIAPYPLRITSLALTSFQAVTNIAASDTAWWLTRIRYTRQSVSETAVNIATKTTRITASTEPAGEAITRLKPWRYDSSLFSTATVNADDTISMIFAPTGSPTAIAGPITITVGYEPL